MQLKYTHENLRNPVAVTGFLDLNRAGRDIGLGLFCRFYNQIACMSSD